MEQVKPFGLPGEHVVVTSSYVTKKREAVREVSHQYDEEEGDVWQFHVGNGDYDPAIIELVTLEQILRIAPELLNLPDVPRGWVAKRGDPSSSWVLERDE